MGLLDNDYGAGAISAAVKGLMQGMQQGDEMSMRREERDENKRFREMELSSRMRAEDEKRAREAALDKYNKEKDASELELKRQELKLKYNPDQQSKQSDPYGMRETNALLAKERLDKALLESKQRKASPVPGYEKTESYVGDPIEERTLRAASSDLDAFRTTITSLKQKVNNASKEDLANPYSDVRKAINNDLKDLQLAYKGDAFAKLGVLTGPDVGFLEQVIENPGSVSNLISGKQGVLNRYDQALKRVNQKFDAKAKTLGLMPLMKNEGSMPETGAVDGDNKSIDPVIEAKKARRAELLAKKAKGGMVANGAN